MASSGSQTFIAANFATGKRYLEFNWQITDVSPTNNTSTVYWWVVYYIADGKTSNKGQENYKVVVDGHTYEGRTDISISEPNMRRTVVSGTETMSHDAYGNKSFSFSVYVETNTWIEGVGNNTHSGSATLDKIDRSAHITGATNFTDEENPTITYYNPSTVDTSIFQAYISFDGSTEDITRHLPINQTSFTFELVDSERRKLRQWLSNTTEKTVYFFLKSSIGGVDYLDSTTATVSLVNYEPTLNPIVKDTNARTVALTGNNQKFIKYYSNAYFETGATAHKEATVASQSVSNAGLTIENQASGTFVGVRSNTFYFGMVDSRGFSVKDFKIIDFIPYIKLTSSLSLGLLTATGTVDFTIKGKYFEGSFGAKDNAMEVEYSVRDKDGNYVFNNGDEGSGWVKLGVVAPDVNDGNYTYTHTITGLDYTQQYTITVNVIDALTPIQTVSSVVAALPVFDWNGDDFHHHTDIVFSNDKRVMGMTADNEQIVALEPCDSEGDTTLGRGNYDSGEGDTRIFGNNIYLTPKEKIIINGKEYGAQRVLWSGASHMNAGQTVSLAQTISEQPNGVVLVFSLYRNGAAEDVSFNTFFVSKHEVGLFPGDPHFFFMGINAGFSTVGAKYLYINDESIGGHEGNTQSGTASGITFNNSYFVLRYVIGV